jgi:hypothetical protein
MDEISQLKIISIDDFARVRNEVIRRIKNRFNEETMNENREQLIHLYVRNKLKRINNIF